MIYIASNKPLPLIVRNERKPSFSISDLAEHEEHVKVQFEFSYVYSVGSHQGCGCGFFKEFKGVEELAKTNDNYRQLNTYLQEAQETGAKHKIYSCWDGDQDVKPEFKEQIDLKRLVEANFEFKECVLYEIL